MSKLSQWTAAIIVSAVCAGTAATAFAQQDKDSQWAKAHPRREQVNQRLANQNQRIKQEKKEGDLTPQQAAKLHREDRQIRQEERVMAKQNGGYITQQEHRTLNQQENAVSKQIGQ